MNCFCASPRCDGRGVFRAVRYSLPMADNVALSRALALHSSVADALLAAAEAFPPERWHEPIAEGKWTTAQIVSHLIATYDILLSDLRTGVGMRVLTKWWQRVLLRIFLVPRLLAGGKFPKTARAPRETRPTTVFEKPDAIDLFRERSRELEEEARKAPARTKITHAYFGSASVAAGVTLCSRHIEHHLVQLPRE